ncbi:MAG: P-II family nitrogen regulator [Planctomycetota bacterium]
MTGEPTSRIIAIVKPFKLDATLLALKGLPVTAISVEEVRGYGRQKGHLELYQGTEYSITFLPKVRLELVCPVGETDRVIEAIRGAARTGRIGDGKILVVDAEAP